MELKIGISNLKVDTIIGVFPSEREFLQELIIDLEVSFEGEVKLDSIDSTLNYDEIVDICKKTSLEKKYFLIESFAKDILNRCFDNLPIFQATICVSKPNAIKDASRAYVKLSRDRK
jgi:dihydroneopterin aldolase